MFSSNERLCFILKKFSTGITDKKGKINPKQTIPDASTVTYKSKYTVENTYISSNSSNLVITIFTADIYVSTTGNDNNTGTISNPVATISKAISKSTNGQTIGILNGTYNLTTELSVNKNCIIKGQSTNDVLIQNSTTNVFKIQQNYIVNFENLTIDGVSKSNNGIHSMAGSTVTVSNSIIKNNNDGFYGEGSTNITAKNSTFINNKIGLSGWTLTNATNCTFTNNSTYDVYNIDGTANLHCNTYTSTAKLNKCSEGSCP